MRKIPALVGALLGIALSATPAHAGPTVCAQDGVAEMCASVEEFQDNNRITVDVTQLDGPGSYQFHYVDLNTGFISPTQDFGQLEFMETNRGYLFGALNNCFRVILTSSAGTNLEVQPVCP